MRTAGMAAVLVGLLAGCSGAAHSATPAASDAGVTPTAAVATPASTLDPLHPIEGEGATRISINGFADWLVMAADTAWVAYEDDMAPLDPASGAVGTRVAVDGSICTAPDADATSLWVGTCDNASLTRIDLASRKTTVIALPGSVPEEGTVGAGEGAAWVVTTAGELVKVDPTTNAVAGSWPLPAGAVGVRAGLGAVWVTVPPRGLLLRLDPADPTKRSEIQVGDGPRFFAIGEGSVWTMDASSGTVTRVAPDGTVQATIRVADGRIEGGDMAVGGGYAWARTSDSLVVRIDPAMNGILRLGPASGSGSVAAGSSAAWVTAHDINAIWRLPLPMREP